MKSDKADADQIFAEYGEGCYTVYSILDNHQYSIVNVMNANVSGKKQKRLKTYIAFFVIGIVVLTLLFYLNHIFTSIAIALLVAYICEPILKWFHKHGLRRWIAVSGVYTIMLALLLLSTAILGPTIFAQGREFIQFMERQYEKIDTQWIDIPGMATDKREEVESEKGAGEVAGIVSSTNVANEMILADTEVANTNKNSEGILPTNSLFDIGYALRTLLESHGESLARKAPAAILRVVRTLFSGATTLAGFAMNFLLVLFYSFFFMLHFPAIINWCGQWIPRRHEKEYREIIKEIDKGVSGFFRGRLIVCVISAVVMSVGFYIAGIPYWLVLGIASGFLGFIPVIGVMIAIIPTVALALLSPDPLFQTVVVLASFAVVQGVVEPLAGTFIISHEVKMHPVTVVIALLIGGALLGILGALIAVPAATTVKILFTRCMRPRLHEILGNT